MDSVPRRAYFLLLLASVVFYLPGLLPGRILLPLDVLCWQLPWSNTPVCQGRTPSNPIISDLVLQLHPWREVIRRDGWRAALWNPYAFAGSPMLANGQSAPLNPLNWLQFVLPVTWSYWLSAVLRTALAAGFTFAFARRRYSMEAAALAAVTYAFSYTFVFAIGFPIGDAIAWLPPLLWAVDTVRPVWLALFTALELLSGQPEVSVVVAGTVGVWMLAQKPPLKTLFKTALAVAVGVFLALPQILPLLRYVSLGAASRIRAEYNPEFFSVHTLIEFLTPQFFGTSEPQRSWGSISGGYFGVLPLLLIAAWIASRPKHAARDPFLWIFLGSLAIVYRIPPLSFLLELPYLRTIFVSKFWISATFAGAMLAAAALDEYRRRRFSLVWAAGLAVLCSGWAFWAFRDFFVALRIERFEIAAAAKLALSLAAALAVLRWRPALASVIAFAELSMYLFGFNPTTPRELFYPVTPAIAFLQQDHERFRIMGDAVLPASLAGIFGLEDVRGYDAITYWPYFQYMTRLDPAFPDLASRLNLTRSAAIDRGTLFARDRFFRPLKKWGPGFLDFLHRGYYWNQQLERVNDPRLLDLLNVKYYLVPKGAPMPPGLEDYRLVFSNEVDVYQNPHMLPRVHVDGDGSRAQIVSYRANEVIVKATGPGLLVEADTLYPGWMAAGYAIEPVEGLLRGVRLPPGIHTVRFSFNAWYWK
jgi:hypothetical protein